MAEICGILIGDGNLTFYKGNYGIVISGNYNEDKEYMDLFVEKLWKKVFNISPIKIRIENEYRFTFYSKAIFAFLTGVIGLPNGSKKFARIPEVLLEDKYVRYVLRGIFDTDFSLSFKKKWKYHKYPVIATAMNNKNLVNQMNGIINAMGIKSNMTLDRERYDKRSGYSKCHDININGKTNLKKWWICIGSKNPRIITRYEVWKKFDMCPPNTSLQTRRKILNGEISIANFYRNSDPKQTI